MATQAYPMFLVPNVSRNLSVKSDLSLLYLQLVKRKYEERQCPNTLPDPRLGGNTHSSPAVRRRRRRRTAVTHPCR